MGDVGREQTGSYGVVGSEKRLFLLLSLGSFRPGADVHFQPLDIWSGEWSVQMAGARSDRLLLSPSRNLSSQFSALSKHSISSARKERRLECLRGISLVPLKPSFISGFAVRTTPLLSTIPRFL